MHRNLILAVALAATTIVGSAGSAAAEGVAAPSTTAPLDEIVATSILWLRDGADIDQVVEANDVVLLENLVGSHGIYLVGSTDESDEKDLSKRLKKDDGVRFAEENHEGESAQDDRFHAWHNDHDGHDDDDDDDDDRLTVAGEDIDLAALHARATGAGVTVAVLDTGADASHELLAGRVIAGWDFVDDDDQPGDDAPGLDSDADGVADEAWGHGTHVAGILAQVAPAADLLIYRVLDSEGRGRVYAASAAIFDAVDRGADVINVSFGLDHKSQSKIFKEAIKYAKDHDVVVVAAAGNGGGDAKRYPAAESDVMAVGASDVGANGLASFANFGDWVEVAAPGVAVRSSLPGNRYGDWSGSSMAAPFVAGQAALLFELAPDVDGKKIVEAIRKSARKAEHGPKFKHGIVDAAASLDRLG